MASAVWSCGERGGLLRAESCLSGAGVDELADAVRDKLVRGEGGGDQCDFASAKVGARCVKGAGESGESILLMWLFSLLTGTLACRAPPTGFRLTVGTVGTE